MNLKKVFFTNVELIKHRLQSNEYLSSQVLYHFLIIIIIIAMNKLWLPVIFYHSWLNIFTFLSSVISPLLCNTLTFLMLVLFKEYFSVSIFPWWQIIYIAEKPWRCGRKSLFCWSSQVLNYSSIRVRIFNQDVSCAVLKGLTYGIWFHTPSTFHLIHI
jgi:hypothetical protein